MGLYDREWFVEDQKRREKEYGGDFSLHSKKNVHRKAKMTPKTDFKKLVRIIGVVTVLLMTYCFLAIVIGGGLPFAGLISDSNLLLHVILTLFVILVCLSIGDTVITRRHIKDLTNAGLEMTTEQFLQLKKKKSGKRQLITAMDCPGVYVLYNETKNMYYVGQGQKVLNRVGQHFTGHGNGDVYADWKYGDKFIIRVIKLQDSGFNTLNSLERHTISTYKAFSKGYNKTRGNRG